MLKCQKKKKTVNIFYLISGIIIFILLVFTVIGGIIWWVRKNQSSNNSSQNSEPPDEPKDDPPSDNPPPSDEDNNDQNEEEKDCPYLKEDKLMAPFGEKEKDYAPELKKIPTNFVVKCWKKGYHWQDILQLWEWKIPEPDIPDLKAEKRIGVIRELAADKDFDKLDKGEYDYNYSDAAPRIGVVRNLVVIGRQVSTGEPKINLDKSIQESSASYDDDKNITRKYIQELVNFALSQEKDINSQQYEISLLWSLGVENFQKEKEIGWGMTCGNSSGSAIYLALCSTLHKLPIGNKVGATGTIKMNEEKVKNLNGQEVILKKGDNFPIGSLKEKTIAAAEKGLNQLVLSKYHSAPNILTKPSKKDPTKNITSDDYQQVVPAETRAKITVHWTENMKDLRELIFQNKLS